jgi:endoglucanase
MCIAGRGQVFDGPHDQRSIDAMRSWRINAVRVPLNESCWLGVGALRRWAPAYRRAVVRWVRLLHRNRLYVILDGHVTTAGRGVAKDILPMASAAQTPRFWRSAARTFRRTRNVVFDLYNEPHDIGWSCWLRGCQVEAGVWNGRPYPAYRAAGMRHLLRAVRSTGARQPVMLAGIEWAVDLSRWTSSIPRDSRRQLVASLHTYGPASGPRTVPCLRPCRRHVARVARRYPVVVAELGQMNCGRDYIDDFVRWADRHGISYLGWSWVAGRWECESGPALIEDYDGAPTRYGAGFRDHLVREGLLQAVAFLGHRLATSGISRLHR